MFFAKTIFKLVAYARGTALKRSGTTTCRGVFLVSASSVLPQLCKLIKCAATFSFSLASVIDALVGARQSSREGDKPSADSANAL